MINTLYPPFQVGGAEKSVSLLAEALVRSGDEVSVITLHPEKTTVVEEKNGVRLYRVPLYNRFWPFARKEKRNVLLRQLWHTKDMWNREAAREVGRILDEVKPDVVHVNNLLGFSVAVMKEIKKRKIRLVHTLRDYWMLCPKCTIFRNGTTCEKRCLDCKVMSINRKPASQWADAVVSNSDYVLKQHKKHGYFKNVPSSVVYNIADTNMQITPLERDPEDKTLIFGFIGRIEAEKGIDVVLEATSKLSNPNWRLRIAGSGLDTYVANLKRRFTDPRIEWLGFVTAPAFYSSIDVSLIASVWAEPLPRTLIETFAAGKSAICAQSGGIPEIASLGKVVETYPPRDSQALASLMDRALGDVDRWRTGGVLDPKSLEIFSESAITGGYHAVYKGR
ncbi:glycosyltransferase family 4 protein [Acidisarcina polymorpha]|nr:glycosyltransferase family 4 protein [Acidisarcina polymorpha]